MQVTAALNTNGIPVLRNAYLPLDFAGGRIWLAGLDDIMKAIPIPIWPFLLPFATCQRTRRADVPCAGLC
jgi:hypothetical protein